MSQPFLPLPSATELRRFFSYDPETGLIHRTHTPRRGKVIPLSEPRLCNSINSNRYVGLQHEGRNLLGHRIAWALHTGKDPAEKFIDHKNRDRADNRLENLRPATRSSNRRNTKMFENNTSGQSGISKIANQVNGKTYLYWRVQWSDETGKRKCKNFPRTDEGIVNAIDFRDTVYGSIKSYSSIVERIAAATAVAEGLSGTGHDLNRSIVAIPAAPAAAPSGKIQSFTDQLESCSSAA